MELLPLVSIPIIYLITALFIKPYLQPKLPFNLCSLCVAVGSTWMILLVLWLSGITISILMLGILLGMCVMGMTNKLEGVYKKRAIKNYWFIRPMIVIGGLYSVFFLLQQQWQLFLFIFLVTFFAVILATLLFQGITHEDVEREHGEDRKSTVMKKLDNCC